MSTLHLTRGLPGSGKSTFARRWVAEDPKHRVRINRDDLRDMVHDPYAGGDTENAVTTASHSAIRTLLRNGRDVIVDDTNLNHRFVEKLLKIAEQTGADIAWHDFVVTPEECKQRDKQRSKAVGDRVIDRFADRYLNDGELPPRPQLTTAVPRFAPYVPNPSRPKAVIVDIDGTLAENYGHRSSYDYGEKILQDRVHTPVLDLLWMLIDRGHEPVIMSGRDEVCSELTVQWLKNCCGLDRSDYYGPYMRATGDRRDDGIVKLELFDRHVRNHFDVRYVLDDRDRVVRAWRSIGLRVLQVADGNF